jgi:hypothetical protein
MYSPFKEKPLGFLLLSHKQPWPSTQRAQKEDETQTNEETRKKRLKDVASL